MSLFEISFLVVIAASSLIGAARGFMSETFGVLAWVVAIFSALIIAPLMTPWMTKHIHQTELAVYATYAVCFILSLIVVSYCFSRIASFARVIMTGWLDAILGLAYGSARGYLVMVVIFLLIRYFQWADTAELLPQSSPLRVIFLQSTHFLETVFQNFLSIHLAFALERAHEARLAGLYKLFTRWG